MRSLLIALAAAATLTAGAAIAQTAQPDASVNPAPGAQPAGAGGQYLSSDTLGDTSKLKAGDPGVVSNGPVPDTPQNRAAYGKPLSNAGKRTAPTGD